MGLWIAIAAGLVGLSYLKDDGPSPEASPPPAAMQVGDGFVKVHPEAPAWRYLEFGTATLGPALAPLPAPGRIVFDEARSAAVTAPLPGRIERVGVQLGQVVRRGEPIIAIRSTAVPELRREAELAAAIVRARRMTLDRVRSLAEIRAVAQKDVLLAEQEVREAELSLSAALEKKRALQIGAFGPSGLYWIRAERDGTVVERRALVGTEVRPERDEPLAVIARLDEVIVIADVVEAEAALVQEGQIATVALSSKATETVSGRVEHVARVVDAARRTVAVRVRIDNRSGRLRPNAFARVTFAPRDEPIVNVPTEAIVTDDDRSVVFVRRAAEGGAFRLERRPVTVGRRGDGRAEIVTGLEPGETIVSRGALLISNAIDLAD